VRDRHRDEDEQEALGVAATVALDADTEYLGEETQISIEAPPERADVETPKSALAHEDAWLPTLPQTMVTRLPEALRPSKVPDLVVDSVATAPVTETTEVDEHTAVDPETAPEPPVQVTASPARPALAVALDRFAGVVQERVRSVDVHDAKRELARMVHTALRGLSGLIEAAAERLEPHLS